MGVDSSYGPLQRGITELLELNLNYNGNPATGIRVVRPLLVGTNRYKHPALIAWWDSGQSYSAKGPGLRTFLLAHIVNAGFTGNHFSTPPVGAFEYAAKNNWIVDYYI